MCAPERKREIRARHLPFKLVGAAQLQHVQVYVHFGVVCRRANELGIGLLLRVEYLPLRRVLVAEIENQSEARRVYELVFRLRFFLLERAAEAIGAERGYLGRCFLRLDQGREKKHQRDKRSFHKGGSSVAKSVYRKSERPHEGAVLFRTSCRFLRLVSHPHVADSTGQIMRYRAQADDAAGEADRRILVQHVVEAQRERQRVVQPLRVIACADIRKHGRIQRVAVDDRHFVGPAERE